MSESIQKTENEKFCSTCGAIILKAAEICPKCGVRQQTDSAATFIESIGDLSESDWLTALLLAIFLGGLGVHRFYVGKIGTGILMILTIGGFFGIWPIIDIIMIATGKFRDKSGRLLSKKRS